MKREPTPVELEKISLAISLGDRIEATSLYMSIAGCGLTEAQNFISALTAGLSASKHEKQSRKQPKRRCFGIFKAVDK